MSTLLFEGNLNTTTSTWTGPTGITLEGFQDSTSTGQTGFVTIRIDNVTPWEIPPQIKVPEVIAYPTGSVPPTVPTPVTSTPIPPPLDRVPPVVVMGQPEQPVHHAAVPEPSTSAMLVIAVALLVISAKLKRT
jgi:hypothetical protein